MTYNQLTTKEFVEKAKNVHKDKYDYSKVKYVNNHTKIIIICPIHGVFEQLPLNHLKGKGCAKCGGNEKWTKEKFIEEARKIHGNRYDYSKVDYINTDTKVCIICHEHGEFWMTPYKHIKRKQNCPMCGGRILSTKMFIEEAEKVHGTKYDYSKSIYEKGSKDTTIICPIHGEFQQKPRYHLQGHGCPLCSESHLERETLLVLDNKNIIYERQKKFKWLGRQSLDFYLPKYNIAIECQGEQHFSKFRFEKNDERLKYRQMLDATKQKLCEENGVELFYINYNELEIENKILNIISLWEK